MITVYPVLRQHMSKNGITNRDIAAVVGLNRFTVWLSMCGIRKWKLTEVVKICCYLRYTDVVQLFVRFNSKQ